MSTFNYARENVGRAVAELVKEGPLKPRLVNAASELSLAPTADLPDNLKEQLQALTRVTANGKIDEKVGAMSSQEAVSLANEIAALYGQMWFHTGQQRPRDVASDTDVNGLLVQ